MHAVHTDAMHRTFSKRVISDMLTAAIVSKMVSEMHRGWPIQILQQATHSKFMAVCQLCRWHKSSMTTLIVLKYWNFYNEDMPTFDLKVVSSEN
jgi:hypothetical protein